MEGPTAIAAYQESLASARKDRLEARAAGCEAEWFSAHKAARRAGQAAYTPSAADADAEQYSALCKLPHKSRQRLRRRVAMRTVGGIQALEPGVVQV